MISIILFIKVVQTLFSILQLQNLLKCIACIQLHCSTQYGNNGITVHRIEKHFLAQKRVIWRIKHKNRSNGLACGRVEVLKCVVNFEQEKGVYFTYMWGKNPWADWAQMFLVVGVHDVITPFKFGDYRFRGFWLAEGQVLPFPIDFESRLYNTHIIVLGVIGSGTLALDWRRIQWPWMT